MPKGKILMGKNAPKPPREDFYGKPDRSKEKTEYYDYASNPLKSEKPVEKTKAKTKSYNVKTYGEAKPVDERGVVRRGPGGPAGTVAPKKRGMNRMEGPVRKRDGFDKRGPVKPKTAEEKKFIMDQLRKNPNRSTVGRGSAKSKPVMPPRRGGK